MAVKDIGTSAAGGAGLGEPALESRPWIADGDATPYLFIDGQGG